MTDLSGSEQFYDGKCESCGKTTTIERLWVSETEYYDLCPDCYKKTLAESKEIE